MSLETIRVSAKGREQLIRLKRRTGIPTWNVLCRWGFLVSLAEPTLPRRDKIPADSSVEMNWRTFAGEKNEGVYWALLRQRCRQDKIEMTNDNLVAQFRLHLHRGISYLAGDRSLRSITDLIRKARIDGD